MTQPNIDPIVKKAERCEAEGRGLQVDIQTKLKAIDPSSREEVFHQIVRSMTPDLGTYSKLALPQNYQADDALTAPSMNIDARAKRVGNAYKDACISK